MGITHESLLSDMSMDYPEGVEKITHHEEFKSPVSKEYLSSLCENDPELTELFDEMIEYFYRYTIDVFAQEGLKQKDEGIQENLEEIRELDVKRTALHNAMIDSVRIFVRALNSKNKDTAWFSKIDKAGRIGYANLALLTTYTDIQHQLPRQEAI